MAGFTTTQLAVAILAAPVGAILHELTRAGGARLLGVSAKPSLVNLHVDFRFDEGVPRWKHRVVLLAPAIVGAICLLGSVGIGFSFGGWWLAAGIGWVFYTLSFRVEDYSIKAARGESWWYERQDDKTRVCLTALSISGFGLVLLIARPSLPDYWQAAAWIVGNAFHNAGAGVLVFGLWAVEGSSRAGAS